MGIFDKIINKKTITPQERRTKNNNYIKNKGIACLDNLPVIESASNVKLKDLDTVCKRAVACLLSIQLACDIAEDYDYDESRKMFYNLLKEYNVENELLKKEKRLFDNNYTKQDAIDVSWTYEAYWALIWALGLIDDIKDAGNICDCQKAIDLVSYCKNYKEFKKSCKPRNTEEILDMLDLYFRYHWACVEKQIKPDTNIGNLNPGVVMERRKGLEWLISDIDDWDEIELNT